MSKQAKIMTASEREEALRQSDQILERCTFALLVMVVASNTLGSFLKGKDHEMREYYGRVWDTHKHVPVGTLFNRPNFEGIAKK